MKKVFRRILGVVLAFLMSVLMVHSSAMALTESQMNFFSQNNILFYDPDGARGNCSTSFSIGDVEASGDYNENAVFVMAYLINEGYSAEAAAAIAGNLRGESASFNPGEAENGYADDVDNSNWRITSNWVCYGRCGFGIAQWTTSGRQDALQNFADEHGMPVTSLELQAMFLIEELVNKYDYSPDTMNEMTLEEATFAVFRYYEAPRASFQEGEYDGVYYNDYDPTTLSMLSESRTPAAYNAYMTRLSYAYGAVDVIEQNNLASVANKMGGTTATDGESVTIIGDSITERSTSDILARLPKADIYSQVSKQFYNGTSENPGGYEILSDLKEYNKLRSVLVYALGTNGNFTLDQAKDVINEAGDKVKIIFVNNYGLPNSGRDYTANNNVLAEVASEYSNVSVANWNSLVSGNPDKYMEDGVHPLMGAGTELFAKMIYDAVDGVVGGVKFNTCSSNGYDYDMEFQVIDGITYVFPLAGATKANYLNPGYPGPAGDSVLSRLPCGAGNICHHDYPAVDLGLRKKMIDGTEYSAADFSGSAFSDLYYYSTGVKVLAFVGGEIRYYGYYSNDGVPSDYVSRCASVTYAGDDGKTYWLGHMSYDPDVKGGDRFEAGEVIGEVGPPQCAQSTQAHLHINVSSPESDRYYIVGLMDLLYDGLPEK